MRAVAIFGSYNGSSIGDTAILLGLLASLQRIGFGGTRIRVIVPRVFDLDLELKAAGLLIDYELIALDQAPKNLFQRVVKKIFRLLAPKSLQARRAEARVKDAIKDCSILLVGGGNLIMDLYPAWPEFIQRICRASVDAGVPYSFVGVGAGPFNTESGKRALRECLQDAYRVYFRDDNSKALCQRVLQFDRSDVMPDLAAALPCASSVRQVRVHARALVNVAAIWGSSWPQPDLHRFERYIREMCTFVGSACQRFGITELQIYESNVGDAEASNAFSKEFLERYGSSISLIPSPSSTSVADLVAMACSARMAFVTRLHAGILASKGGCQLVAVCYQPKVGDVLRELGLKPCLINLSDLEGGSAAVPDLLDPVGFLDLNSEIDKFLIEATGNKCTY